MISKHNIYFKLFKANSLQKKKGYQGRFIKKKNHLNVLLYRYSVRLLLTKKTCLNPTQNDSLEGQWLSSVILQLSTSAWDKYVPEITTLQLHLLTHTPSAKPPSQETHNTLQVSAQLLRFHKVKLASVGQLVFNPSLPRLCVGESKFWDSSLKSPIRSCHRHTCCTRPGSEAPWDPAVSDPRSKSGLPF